MWERKGVMAAAHPVIKKWVREGGGLPEYLFLSLLWLNVSREGRSDCLPQVSYPLSHPWGCPTGPRLTSHPTLRLAILGDGPDKFHLPDEMDSKLRVGEQ